MKVIVTGSLGNISKPLTELLVQKGHNVVVISSKQDKQKGIEALGAVAAIGSVEDATFLTAAFRGSDIVYCMIPPNYWFNGADPIEYCRQVGNNYAQAIRQAGVKRAVQLSSFGADLDKGTGFILGAHHVEKILGGLSDVAITYIRPTSFYNNLYGFTDMIKGAGFIAANYGGEDKLSFVSGKDIAAAIVEEMETPPVHRKVRYVASDELTGNQVAGVLGAAIGKPGLKWITITDEETLSGLEARGMSRIIAANLVELYACYHSGELSKDYERNKPKEFGKIKLTDFAKEFARGF
ncbi:MAG: NmrA family NAD(P)-binding protein [Chitinophagaceae bacterium]|nr:NmrA family NAD(P)-binding protein [Chitinophagaceae bacterium]